MAKKQETKSKAKVLVQFIQDRSGSMFSVWSETLSGFRNFVEGLQKGAKEDGVEYLFTLTTFDTLIEMPLKEVAIGEVSLDELAKCNPRGSTALYDAVGKTLEATKTVADKYICVIVTDGQENSSREWSKDAVHSAIDAKIKLGNWTFTYLGTQPETWADASSLGIGLGATSTYSGAQAGATYTVMTNSVRAFAASPQRMSYNLMNDDKYTDQDAKMKAGMGSHATATPKPHFVTGLQHGPVTAAKKSSKSWRKQ